MMYEDIRDARGNKIGYMYLLTAKKEVYLNGKGKIGYIDSLYPNEHKAFNSRCQIVAKWKSYDDCTYDANNKKIGKGDLLLEALIQSVLG